MPPQFPARRRHQHRCQIRRHAVHQRLRLRVAQPHVELQRLRAIDSHHQAGVEKARETRRLNGRPNDRVQDSLGFRLRQNSRIAVCAHAAGIRPRISVVHALVILRRRERQYISSITQCDEADLFAFEKFLDHQPRAQRVDRSPRR